MSPLWGLTDAEASRPTWINLATYPSGTTLIFVDEDEAQTEAAKLKGIKAPGWHLYFEHLGWSTQRAILAEETALAGAVTSFGALVTAYDAAVLAAAVNTDVVDTYAALTAYDPIAFPIIGTNTQAEIIAADATTQIAILAEETALSGAVTSFGALVTAYDAAVFADAANTDVVTTYAALTAYDSLAFPIIGKNTQAEIIAIDVAQTRYKTELIVAARVPFTDAGDDVADNTILTDYNVYVTTQPADVTVIAGAAVNLTVVAESNPAGVVTYQWQKLNVDVWDNIGGATLATYTIAISVVGDSGEYRVAVTAADTTTTVFSEAATVLVNP